MYKPKPAVSAAQSEEIRKLRDEAITIIAWVAGNTHGHAVWAQVEPFVGRGGSWYNPIMRLKSSPDADPETEAMLNVALYREWFGKGQSVPFNEDEAASRLERGLQIIDALKKLVSRP